MRRGVAPAYVAACAEASRCVTASSAHAIVDGMVILTCDVQNNLYCRNACKGRRLTFCDETASRLKRPVGLFHAEGDPRTFFAVQTLVFPALLAIDELSRRDWHALRFKGTH